MATKDKKKESKSRQPKVYITLEGKSGIIQPRTMTMMRNQYTMVQNKIVAVIVEKFQDIIHEIFTGKNRNKNLQSIPIDKMKELAPFLTEKRTLSIDDASRGDLEFEVEIADFGLPKDQYKELKDALKAMTHIGVEIPMVGENGRQYEFYGNLFSVVVPKKRESYKTKIKFNMDFPVAVQLFNARMGYDKMFSEVIKNNTRSLCAQRMYLFISSWRNKKNQTLTFKQTEFRKDIGYANSYPTYNRLRENVLEPARKELKQLADDGFCDLYFEYSKGYAVKGRKTGEPDYVKLVVYETPTFITSENEKIVEYLSKQEQFTFMNILNREFNIDLDQAEYYCKKVRRDSKVAFMDKIMAIKRYITEKGKDIKNPTEYAISSLNNYMEETKPKPTTQMPDPTFWNDEDFAEVIVEESEH